MKVLTVSPLWEGDNPTVVVAYLNAMLSQTLSHNMFLVFAINECALKEDSPFYQTMKSWASNHRKWFADCQVKYFEGKWNIPMWEVPVLTIYRRFSQQMILQDKSLSHLWMVSGDNIPSPKALEMLVEDDKDVVGLPCFHRNATMPYLNIQKWQGPQPYLLYSEVPKNQIIEVDGLSTACILLKRHVVEKISFEYRLDALDLDFAVSKSIREQSFKIYADTREICGHANPDGTILDENYWFKTQPWLK